jgi:hypothetical protein
MDYGLWIMNYIAYGMNFRQGWKPYKFRPCAVSIHKLSMNYEF